MGSSQTRARTRVPCIGRQILNHCATREVPLLVSLVAKTKIKEPSGSSGPAPKEGWLPSRLPPCPACRLCCAIRAAHVPAPLTDGTILLGVKGLFLLNSVMKERVLCSGEWPETRERRGGVGEGCFGLYHLSSQCPGHVHLSDLVAPFHQGFLNLNEQRDHPEGLLHHIAGCHHCVSDSFGLDRTEEFAFPVSSQVMFMLQVWGPHLENHWLRSVPWAMGLELKRI